MNQCNYNLWRNYNNKSEFVEIPQCLPGLCTKLGNYSTAYHCLCLTAFIKTFFSTSVFWYRSLKGILGHDDSLSLSYWWRTSYSVCQHLLSDRNTCLFLFVPFSRDTWQQLEWLQPLVLTVVAIYHRFQLKRIHLFNTSETTTKSEGKQTKHFGSTAHMQMKR